MKSKIKIYGPPILKAVKALEKIAFDFPEVCIMHTKFALGPLLKGEPLLEYFGGPGVISEKRCQNIISKSKESLGEYDFFFEWFRNPTSSELDSLIEKIDEALSEVGVRYTITTL